MKGEAKVSENQCALLAAAITAGILWLTGTTGCGFTAGPVTMGTTGFLHEVNAGKRPQSAKLETIRPEERAEMNAFLEKEYGHANR